ncbi:MAG: SGNH/GDSL hydrolase family protein [Oscillospiraceae bacterium]|nr:SGNH/GDSL hydrolase family protein [Oscillospiraceae bacterium]
MGVDGLHPNEQGHILIAEKMAEFINALYTE